MWTIEDWARRHGVSAAAIEEFRGNLGIAALGAMGVPPSGDAPGSEGKQQSLIRLEAAQAGIRLFRNNSGAFKDETGRVVRFGLANESKQINEVLKSPDLIGWRKRLITSEMVGSIIGQACMREVKHEGWKFSPNDAHANAQLNFLNLAIADGCDASFATGPGTL